MGIWYILGGGIKSKSDKAFTLIELLAVIVILAIIAIIATPIILNIINKAKKSAFLDSAYGILESAKLYYTESMLNGGISEDKIFLFEGDIPEGLNYSGTSPKGGNIIVRADGNISLAIHNKEWCAKKRETDKVITLEKYEEGKCSLMDVPTAEEMNPEVPVLNGLIPIKWNGDNWIVADSNNSAGIYQWYDYDIQMWANAASVIEEYRNKEVGTIVPEEAVLAYFVWIPRYEYMYTNLGTEYAGGSQTEPGEIKINFIAKSKTVATSNYKIHPAFHFGGTELSGIWIGKFETAGEFDNCDSEMHPMEDDESISCWSLNIKPNLSSLGKQISVLFSLAQKFSSSENDFGIDILADAHMIKNSEWGAVAYLSQSKYGKYGNSSYTGANKEVYQNKSDDSITGCSSGSPRNENTDYGCQYTYEKKEGTGASTTGTIYGVYDMSGGQDEVVMGVYRGSDVSDTWGTTDGNYAGFDSAPASKYYDEYKTDSATTACSGGICYGHSLSETSGWYNNTAHFVQAECPWTLRGGSFGNMNAAGIFAFECHTSNALGGQWPRLRVVLLGR